MDNGVMNCEENSKFEYKPGVKKKVNELESRLVSISGIPNDVKKGRIRRQSVQKEKLCEPVSTELPMIDKKSNLSNGIILNASTITQSDFSPLHEQKSKFYIQQNDQTCHLNKQLKTNNTDESLNAQNGNKRLVSTFQSEEIQSQNLTKTPIPAPRKHLSQTLQRNMEEELRSENLSNTPRGDSVSGSSTRRSSEDDGFAEMASESDQFDDSTMPLPKIKDNAFLLKDKLETNEFFTGKITELQVPSQHSNLRRASLNPKSTFEIGNSDPKPSRTRTESTNSAENFVIRQISKADDDDNRRESQTEVKIDVLQSKSSPQIESGVRSPVVVRSKRLSNSAASILVLGLPQSGKSKTIDSLVQRQVTQDSTSAREIVEYTAKIKILDSSNLFSLKIIETPGYSNDSKIFSDAQLMSTLVNYLESKDGLHGKTPTIVLVVFRFNDQRLWNPEDEHPDIVNFLKLIHNFQQYMNDNKYANFVFVLTHFLNDHVSNHDLKRPQGKILELINLIQKYTSLPLPIMVVCGENETKNKVIAGKQTLMDNSLPMAVKLPNGETYPYNLIEKIKVLLTKKGRDSVGETVLRTAFGIEYPYSIKECKVTQKIPLMPLTHSSVLDMKKKIQHAYLDIERTEIFNLLEIGWENIDLKIRKQFPQSLFTVQQIFQTKKVSNFVDIPEDPKKILNLVRQMPSNLAVKDLLIDTLELKVPACYSALYIGQGFDLSRDISTNVSPFHFGTGLKTSPVGLIPNEFECKLRDDREICFKFFNEVEEFVSERLKDLNLRYSVSPNSLSALSAAASSTMGQRWGYNLIKNQEPNKSTIATAIIEYRIFQMSLHPQPDLKFKPQFWEVIEGIPDLDIKDAVSVSTWRDFFSYWGTHVIKSAYGGGSVEITFRGSILSKIYNAMRKDFIFPSEEYDTSRVFQWITGDGLDFVASCGTDVKNDFVQGYDVESHFHGGDIRYQQVDLTKLESKEDVANIREDWKESLALNPVMLETNLVLVPLSYYVRDKSEGIATKIDVALHYFYSDFMVSQGKQSSCTIL